MVRRNETGRLPNALARQLVFLTVPSPVPVGTSVPVTREKAGTPGRPSGRDAVKSGRGNMCGLLEDWSPRALASPRGFDTSGKVAFNGSSERPDDCDRDSGFERASARICTAQVEFASII